MRFLAEHIHESNLIEGIDNPQADKDGLGAFDFLNDGPFTLGRILGAQAMIVAHQDDPTLVGLRSCRVFVGDREGAQPDMVRQLLAEWVAGNREMTPREAHVCFETIHPFKDGNGRTGRALMWLHELSLGKSPTLLLASRRRDYYEWFRR